MAVALVVTLAAGGCAALSGRGGDGLDARADDRGAALARLLVDNQTGERLAVGYRPAAGPGAEVIVGRVEPWSRAETAPIPAGEPIFLVARREAGDELVLAPRSFQVDGEWVWVIPADALFTAAAEEAR